MEENIQRLEGYRGLDIGRLGDIKILGSMLDAEEEGKVIFNCIVELNFLTYYAKILH